MSSNPTGTAGVWACGAAFTSSTLALRASRSPPDRKGLYSSCHLSGMRRSSRFPSPQPAQGVSATCQLLGRFLEAAPPTSKPRALVLRIGFGYGSMNKSMSPLAFSWFQRKLEVSVVSGTGLAQPGRVGVAGVLAAWPRRGRLCLIWPVTVLGSGAKNIRVSLFLKAPKTLLCSTGVPTRATECPLHS